MADPPTFTGIRKFGSKTNTVYFQPQSNLPSRSGVRKIVGSLVRKNRKIVVSNTDHPVFQPQSNPPSRSGVRKIVGSLVRKNSNIVVSNTDHPVFQPQSNPPSRSGVRKIVGSLVRKNSNIVVSNTDHPVFQPQLNPPSIGGIGNTFDSNTRPVFFQPLLNTPSGQAEEREEIVTKKKSGMAEIGSAVGKVVDLLFVVAKKEIGYMWNCSENIENFRHEAQKLKVMRGGVQELIDISILKGDKLSYGVEHWVKEADTGISKAEEFLEQVANAKKTCCKIGLCGNWGTLHRYGKSATKMVPTLLLLRERGSTYESCVSVETPATGPLDVYQNKDLDDLRTHNSALKDIIAALEDASIQITGIYGLGGVGKTKLAMEVVARVKNNVFADVAFTTVSQTVDVEKIKKDIGEATKRIMKGDKILIILDDVWEKLNLEELCIPCGSNYMNCKILLTSRNEKVCQKMNAQSKICVNSLPTEEAWILFTRVVGERLEKDANLKRVALKVVEECGGLPLLIQAIGNALKDENIESWNRALTQLQKHAPLDIDNEIRKAFTRLKLSYDYLRSEEAKWCFLLCGLFHEDEDIELEDLVRYVVGLELFEDLDSIEDARHRVRNAVNILTSSCLLLNAEDDKGCTKMHKVVRDVALLIGSQRENKYLLKAGKDLTEWRPRDNNVKDLTDYKKTNFDDFPGSYDSMIRMLDKKGPFRTILKANNHDRSIIKDGRSGKVYKEKLRWNGRLMYVAIWKLDRQYRENYDDFKREIEFLSDFKHDNISSIYKYFDKDIEIKNIIIYEHTIHGNLHGHLSNSALTWSRRLQICLGVARALNYIHNQGFIHCDINSSKILLDEDWTPRIFGFELCTKYPQSWRDRLHLSRYLGTTNVMTPKYDVYLYGVLLSEVLCGKKPLFDEDGFNGKLDNNIDPSLEKHIGSQSMKFIIIIAYNCLDKNLVVRPSMNQIVKDLEEALELQRKEENLELSTNRDEDATSNRLLMKYLEIPLIEIKRATDNFADACIIGYGGFGTVYRAILNVLDIQSVSSIEGKYSKEELPRESKTVAIKRLSKKGDEQAEKGFRTEIELLTSYKHPNVVSLLGFYRDANETILVYEFALNGSLSDYLRSKLSLTWSQRIQICLQVAHGISYLHTNTIIHRDIKSQNILLDENLNAKVADFGLSTLHPTADGGKSTIVTQNLAGTEVYMDPEYRITGGYKKESDIYSFGVVLFEVLSGKMASDSTYMRENDDGLAPIVRRRFKDGTLMDLIDPKMLEDDEYTFTLNKGPTQDSFNLFSKVGYECLAKTQAERPKMEVVIKKLEDALEVQGETMVLSKFRLSNIESATQNFTKTYMGSDTYGKVYKAQLDLFESNSLLATKGKKNDEPPIGVAIKRISGTEKEHGEERFFSEIEMHTRYKHPNISPLLGICYEGDNMLLVYEHASDESLDDYLRDTDNMTKHTWIQRLHQCLGIAHGLNHLHTLMDRKQEMIHVDIRSANILLGKSGEAKIGYFGLSKLLPPNQEASTDTTNNKVRTNVYCCPEYQKTGERKKESDIYSFGVVLFEIFCGRLAYDPVYTDKKDHGLAPIARQCFSDGTIKEMIDPALKEETLEDILISNTEPILDSLGTCLRIANQCLAENQTERPTMQIVIKELEIMLNIQENLKTFQISFKDVKSATGNFSQKNCFGSGRYWKAYKGELRHSSNANLASASASGGGGARASASASVGPSASAGPTANADPTASDANANTNTYFIVAKRWNSKSNQGDHQFRMELSIIIKLKHENIIGLVGYCHEMDERIIVYEQASKGSLNMYLNDATLTWMKRLKICTDVARALEYLHRGDGMLKKLVRKNIQSSAILLNDDWKAKISKLEMSSLDSLQQDMEHVSDNAYGAFGYLDPEYKQGYLTEKSDIYSFGVVMFEILCGRLAWSEGFEDHSESLGPLAKRYYEGGKLDEMVFKDIKEQIGPESMAIYADIAYQCLHDIREKRPTAGEVVLQLKKALDLQVITRLEDLEAVDFKETPKDCLAFVF